MKGKRGSGKEAITLTWTGQEAVRGRRTVGTEKKTGLLQLRLQVPGGSRHGSGEGGILTSNFPGSGWAARGLRLVKPGHCTPLGLVGGAEGTPAKNWESDISRWANGPR